MAFSLNSIANPRSVAVIGASRHEGKIGRKVMSNVKRTFKGEVYPINPKADEVMGRKAYKSISDVPDEVELAIICIPAASANSVVEECGKKGVKALVVITAGFKEVGGEGVLLENEMVKLAGKYGMRVLGPNCLGVIAEAGNFSFATPPATSAPPEMRKRSSSIVAATPSAEKRGEIALLSQSGAMATALLDWSVGKVDFSAFISLGNKSDLDEIDFIEYLADDDNTKVICAYMEDVKNGERFLKVVSAATKKKPVIILKSGRSAQGAKAASSHTGALTGSDVAFDMAFRKAGVIRADSVTDLFNYALTFLIAPIPRGSNFAIVTNAGGPGIITTDAMEKEGVGFAQFTEETVKKLRKKLPVESNFYNPVDIIGDAPPERYEFAVKTLFEAPHSEVAGAIIVLTPQAQTKPPIVAQKMGEIRAMYPEKVLVAAFIGEKSVREAAIALTNAGVPTCDFPEEAVRDVRGLTQYAAFLQEPIVAEKPFPKFDVDNDVVRGVMAKAREENRTKLLSFEKNEILRAYHIKHPKSDLCKSANDAGDVASAVGFPCAAKIVSPHIHYKFDIGGIVLNINSPEEAKEAYLQIVSNGQKFGPPGARILGVDFQQMVTAEKGAKKTELIIGMQRDPLWGPMLMVGYGGIYADYVQDVAFDLAYHFDRADAQALLSKTKISKILEGVRGEPRSDVDGVLDILLRLSQLVNDFPEVKELDINPCIVFEKEVSIADIAITIDRDQRAQKKVNV